MGRAGRVFDDILTTVGLTRLDVFVTNVVKCYPPGHRRPSPEEMKSCAGHWHQQLEVLHPRLVVTLGKTALTAIAPGLALSVVHGHAFGSDFGIVFPMYHPAMALYSPIEGRALLMHDAALLRVVVDYLVDRDLRLFNR